MEIKLKEDKIFIKFHILRNKELQTFIRKIIGIFPGEEKNVFKFIRLATIWAMGSSIAETLSIGLFTENIGANALPVMYIITSLCLIAVSCLYVYFLKYFSPYKIMLTTMFVAAIVYSSIALTFFTTLPKWFWYFVQIFSYSFGSALLACFWMFVDQYHDLQDAKRIYGIYNAAYFFGFIISGTLINFAYERLGPAFLFFVVVLCLIQSIIDARNIFKKVPAMEDDVADDFFSGSKRTFAAMFAEFYKSPFTIYVIAVSLIVKLLRTFTEYGYLDYLEKTFIANPEILSYSITEFLARCKAIISAANIIIGMFFYRRLISRVGLSNLILLPPIYFMGLYSQWMIYETLAIAILGIFAIECILYTIEDNNFNLLITASPKKLKGILRIINDSFFEPIGMLLSAFFLLLLKSEHKILGLIFSILFISFSLVVKYLYPKAIFKTLKENKVRFERDIKYWLYKLTKRDQKTTITALFKFLNSDNENTKLLAFQTLLNFNSKTILNEVIYYFDKFLESTKEKALDIFEESIFSNDPLVIEKIDGILKNSTEELLTKKCHYYLAKQGLLHPEKVLDDLDHKDLIKRASSIITLKHSKANKNLSKASLYRTIAGKETKLLFNYNKIEEICTGLNILSLDDTNEATELALSYLSNKNLIVKKHAAYALSKITDKTDSRFAPILIEEIKNTSDNNIRLNCLKAIGNINDSTTVVDLLKLSIHFRPNEKRFLESIILNMGLKNVPILISILKDRSLNERSRILAGKILSKLSHAQLKNNVSDIVKIEIEKAQFFFYFANTIQKQHPLYDLSLLTNALHTGYQSIMDFIIHILGTASLIEDTDLIVKALHSKNAKSHAHAIETLEKSIDRSIFNKFNYLIDDIPLQYKIDEVVKHIDSNLSLKDLLDKLEKSQLFFDKIIAVHLKAKMRIPDWKQSLREQIKTSDESFHQYAYELLEQ